MFNNAVVTLWQTGGTGVVLTKANLIKASGGFMVTVTGLAVATNYNITVQATFDTTTTIASDPTTGKSQ